MNRFLKNVAGRLALLACLMLPVWAWAGPTSGLWSEDPSRSLLADAPHPAEYRVLTLDEAAASDHLKNAFHRGMAVDIALPEPNGGFTDFMVVDSGTLPAELKAKYPDILTFKGQDAQGRRVRLDVSPLGFQAMVFDPAGVWVVRPEQFGAGDRYLVFRRAELQVPGGTGVCEVHDTHVDATGLNLSGEGNAPMTETGVQHRHYRAAVAANNRYITAVGGGTVAGGLAATTTAVNRVNEVYEYDMAIQLTLVPNNDLIMYPNAATDPFASNGTGVINNSTSVINAAIGAGNYDIGHVFTTGSGGVAGLRVVCGSSKARGTTGLPNPTGDAFYIDFVAHEMGHQFGGNHPFNGSLGNCSGGNRNGSTAYEPGSGSSIMAYAGICSSDDLQPHSDPFFHAISLQEITNFSNGSGNCSVNTPNPNQAPVIDTGSLSGGYTIPARTPFLMSGTATDADSGDNVMYSWEEWDLGPQAPLSAGDNGSSPIFRTWPPMPTGVRYFPSLSTILGGPPKKGETLPTTNRTLKFRLTARDLRAGNGTSSSVDTSITVSSGAGPFKVTAPASGASWGAGQSQTVTWDVANTNLAPVSCTSVDIDLSVDGGQTFPVPLVASVPNSGSAAISVPSVSTTQARVRVNCANNIFFNISPADFTITGGTGSYTVGGTVSGLAGTGLALKLNGGAALPITANGSFTFPAALPGGSAYAVSVAAQPINPAQVCTVSNGSGTIGSSNVTNVQVNCVTGTPTTFSVGGNVTGLTGTGLKLRLNSGANLLINGDGPFVFRNELDDGESYNVAITQQPAGQTCTVANGSGVIAGANVTDVVVDCNEPVVTYTIGGAVSGLAGTGLVLDLNGAAQLPIAADGVFTFPGGLPSGSAYVVGVVSQPGNPAQTCTVANGSGSVGTTNVSDVAVTCVTDVTDQIFADGFDDGGPAACVPQQLFEDPSFEATVDFENPFWDSVDSIGGTSFCDASCDDGGTFVARTGSWFVWMGGWDQANTADLSQSVVFPAGQARWLNYWMVNHLSGDATAALQLMIDGAVVQNIAAGGSPTDWELQTFEVPAQYLDGQAHEVRFDWSADAPNGDIAGVMMDDVTLECGAAPPRAAPARMGPATQRARVH